LLQSGRLNATSTPEEAVLIVREIRFTVAGQDPNQQMKMLNWKALQVKP
jgi:hypothetical protein